MDSPDLYPQITQITQITGGMTGRLPLCQGANALTAWHGAKRQILR